MKSRLVLTTLAALGLFIIDGVAANAAPPLTRYFIGRSTTSTTDWADQENWSTCSCTCGGGSGKPIDGDHVIICKRKTATIDSASLDLGADDVFASLEIMEGATLSFAPDVADTMEISGADGLDVRVGGRLILDAAIAVPTLLLSGGGTYIIDGTLRLEDGAATLRFSSDSILCGCGMIEGQDNSALIHIDNGVTLTLATPGRIEGQLTITETTAGTDPTFVNDGLVHANAIGGIITLTALTHRGCGQFRISGNDASEIIFATGDASRMDACFYVLQGILNIDIPFYTSGGLRCVDGGTGDVCVRCDPGTNEQCIFAGCCGC